MNRVDENMAIDARTWEEAEAWFSRLLADDHGDRRDFESWLHATPAHTAAWAKTQALWERMGTFVQDETLSDYVREALEPDAIISLLIRLSRCSRVDNDPRAGASDSRIRLLPRSW